MERFSERTKRRAFSTLRAEKHILQLASSQVPKSFPSSPFRVSPYFDVILQIVCSGTCTGVEGVLDVAGLEEKLIFGGALIANQAESASLTGGMGKC